MRNMGPVSEHELQRVGSGWQRNSRFRLPLAEMAVIVIHRDRVLECGTCQLLVDQEMMVTGSSCSLALKASRRNAHAGKAKLYDDRAGNRVTILEVDEIDLRPCGRRRFLRKAERDITLVHLRH